MHFYNLGLKIVLNCAIKILFFLADFIVPYLCSSGVPKVLQVWYVPWAPPEGGATKQFLLKADKPSSNRFVDDFFATFKKSCHSQWHMNVRGGSGGAMPLAAHPKNIYIY